MANTYQLIPDLVRFYGKEELHLADKTWPLHIPADMRLVAILSNDVYWHNQPLEVALDITEPERYTMYIDQVRNEKWTGIQLFYVPERRIYHCRVRYET